MRNRLGLGLLPALREDDLDPAVIGGAGPPGDEAGRLDLIHEPGGGAAIQRGEVVRGDAPRLGLYGFGAAAHLVAQVATRRGSEVFAFTRPGDSLGQRFARSLGAVWAAGSDDRAPVPLDAAVIFAPVGSLVPTALGAVGPGGRVVCAGIHMSDAGGR